MYDVNEFKKLKEGEGKHIISVFVADEAGLINRVAGVFARRGESSSHTTPQHTQHSMAWHSTTQPNMRRCEYDQPCGKLVRQHTTHTHTCSAAWASASRL